MPPAPVGPGEKLYCVSYAPFRGDQSPLDASTFIEPWQIEEDLTRLARLTDCVRTYSVDFGLERIAEIAGRHGLKVMQGLWLSGSAEKNRYQVETAVALANQYPDVIRAIVVGNEVLLRGEMSAPELASTIRAVKARVKVPVTYADVWEFWLRHRDVAAAADFITIHILPYWEDFPITAREAAAHLASIRQKVTAAFVGKDVIVGEVGWPSAGRMREGALPSRSNQARVIQDVLALAKRDNFRVNVIEAFDQPWKRALEGTVGGHWGLLDDKTRAFKFNWGEPVSNHPSWMWQASGGIAFAALVFGAALAARRRNEPHLKLWFAVAVNAMVGGVLLGWTIENIPVESLGIGGWSRSLAIAAIAFIAPPLGAAMLVSGRAMARFSRIIGPASDRLRDRLALVFGYVLIALTVLAIVVALGLVFDPRYRDFPFAPLTAAVVPYGLHSLLIAQGAGARGAAETVGAGLLALSTIYIAVNETVANWQSLWLCAVFAALAIILVRLRAARD